MSCSFSSEPREPNEVQRRGDYISRVLWCFLIPLGLFIIFFVVNPSLIGLSYKRSLCGPVECPPMPSTTRRVPIKYATPPPTTTAQTTLDYATIKQNIIDSQPSTASTLALIFGCTFGIMLLYYLMSNPGSDCTAPTTCTCSFACCLRRSASEHDSAGSLYPPPHYSRCGSVNFNSAPPPYSEVTAKPDLYPLVITCGEGNGKDMGNFLMVQYFNDQVVRATRPLSATSTAESLDSSLLCNATNEVNSVMPPPYSSASNYEGMECRPSLLRSQSSPAEPLALRTHTPAETRSDPNTFRDNLITSPVQSLDTTFDLELELMDCEMYCDGGCKPRLGPSPPVHRSPSDRDRIYENYGLRHLYDCPSPEACESPPQPTSPTQTLPDATLRRPSDEERRKAAPKTKVPRFYMPLTDAYPCGSSRMPAGTRASSRSAPATPCVSLVPNLLNFTQRVSASRLGSRSSKLGEENNPLLSEVEHGRDDDNNKF